MTTILSTSQAIDHLFLLTLLSSSHAKQGKLFERVMATTEGKPREEKVYQVEIRVNGVELDFHDFTDKVRGQFDELVMAAARKLLDGQFADRFRVISGAIYDAQTHAKNLRNALEAEARKAWGLPPRQDEDD